MTHYARIDGLNNVYCVHKGNLTSVTITLKDKSLCVVSPIAGLPKSAYEPLEAIGKVQHVLAPNHYHNKGIAGFTKAFPNVNTYASDAAADRLYKQTKTHFESLQKLAKLFAKGTSLLEPEGLKTGEIWLRFKTSALTAWLVVDAFSGPKLNKSATEGTKPELLKTFPNYGIADRKVYCAWAEKQANKDTPTLLLPCHGSIVRSPTMTKSILTLLKKTK